MAFVEYLVIKLTTNKLFDKLAITEIVVVTIVCYFLYLVID